MNCEEARALRTNGRIINRMKRVSVMFIIRNSRAIYNDMEKYIIVSFKGLNNDISIIQ